MTELHKNLTKGWKGSGDCRTCEAKYRCQRGCDAHDKAQAQEVKKALLYEADRKSNSGRMDGGAP